MPYIVDRNKIIPVNVNAKYDSKPLPYPPSDIQSVFIHYDYDLKRNVPTENKIDNGGTDINGKSSI